MTWQSDLKRDMKQVNHNLAEANRLLAKSRALTEDGAILTDVELEDIYTLTTAAAKEIVDMRKMISARITARARNAEQVVVHKPRPQGAS